MLFISELKVVFVTSSVMWNPTISENDYIICVMFREGLTKTDL